MDTLVPTAKVVFGPWRDAMRCLVGDARLVVITDPTVHGLYRASLHDLDVFEVPAGDAGKRLSVVEQIYGELYRREVERSDCILAFGGGAICDIAGFAAATYLRGLRFGSVPTTLLAQVDAAHGGKNGLNFEGRKNLIGTIRQPEFIICDAAFFATLPQDQFRDGLAEVIKHGVIADPAILELVASTHNRAPEIVAQMIARSLAVKNSIVQRDMFEAGERRKLNFGHTIGHGFEVVCGVSHGQAVAVGMVYELALSVLWGRLAPEVAEHIVRIISNTGLPRDLEFDRTKVLEAIRYDKKRVGTRVAMPIVHALGVAVVEEVEMTEIEQILHRGAIHAR